MKWKKKLNSQWILYLFKPCWYEDKNDIALGAYDSRICKTCPERFWIIDTPIKKVRI